MGLTVAKKHQYYKVETGGGAPAVWTALGSYAIVL